MENLKDYITEWKRGNYKVLDELIGNTQEVVYKDNKKITVERLRFNDKALNSIYWKLYRKYYSLQSSDFDSYVSNAIFRVDNEDNIKSIFDNVDLNKSPQEIVNLIAKRLGGFIYNQGLADGKIKPKDDDEDKNKKKFTVEYDEFANSGYDDSNIYFSDDEVSDQTLRKSDREVAEEYIRVDDDSEPYQEFKDYVGGDIRNLLSDKQKKLYDLLQDVSLTQQEIADELEMTQQAVSQMSKAIKKRINKKYFEFMTLKRVVKNRNTFRTIKGFMQQYQTIIIYDTDESFDYFGYTIQFLESVYIKNEETLTPKDLQKNKINYTYTILDVVTDYVNTNTYKIVEEYIFKEDTNLKLTQRKKDSFVLNIRKAFNQYTNDVEKAVKGLSEKVAIKGNEQKYIHLLL